MKYNIILQICILFTIISCNQANKKLIVESVKKDQPLVEKKKINEIADFQNGYAFYTKGYSDYGYAVIDLANVSEWGDLNITGKEKFISEELYESLPKFHLQKYDIIIAMTDVTSALRILAKSAIIDA